MTDLDLIPTPSTAISDSVLARAGLTLADTYHGVFSLETIMRYLHESYQLLASSARTTAHLPNLAIRFATQRLAAAARVNGAIISTVPEVLFVCLHNAGRSQMAAALLQHHSAGRVRVRSAGSVPAGEINVDIIEALAEVGVDLTTAFPKPLTDDVVQASDVVVLMGCGDACPVYPGKRYLNWDLSDPAGQDLEAIRSIRDEIDARVRTLLAELTIDRKVVS